ncbi:MAG: hypothetical protein WEA99_13370 [Brumimicrobium sp.]
MRTLLFISILVLTKVLFGQEHKTFSFDFSYGINQYKMNEVNLFYIDSFAALPENDLLRDYVKRGKSFRLGVNYAPISWLDIGIYGNYQFSSLKSSPWKAYNDPELGETVYNKSYFELRTEAISLGLGSTFYFSELFKAKDLFTEIRLGLELNGGISFTKISPIHLVYTFTTFDLTEEYFSKEIFQGQIGLKLEYDFTQQPIFTTLGLKAGYQFLKTGTVRDAAGQEWLINDKYPINLDFSGFYYGVYLKIGK